MACVFQSTGCGIQNAHLTSCVVWARYWDPLLLFLPTHEHAAHEYKWVAAVLGKGGGGGDKAGKRGTPHCTVYVHGYVISTRVSWLLGSMVEFNYGIAVYLCQTTWTGSAYHELLAYQTDLASVWVLSMTLWCELSRQPILLNQQGI